MPVFPPGDTTVLDRFDRANGNVWDGDGATLWDDVDLTGAASKLRVVDGRLAATAEGGGLTNESAADGIRIFTVATGAGSGYVMFFFRMVGDDGYAFSMAGATWTLYEVTGGVFTEVDAQPVTNSLSTGMRVGVRFEGDEITVHVGNSLYLNPTPVFTLDGLTTTTTGACGFQMSSSLWALDDYCSASLIAPTEPVTIHVDPDHPDASDTYTRSEASSPDTPLITVQQAGWLARSDPAWDEGDTILVEVCETANLGDLTDSHLQPGLDYRSLDRTPDAVGWPFGNNAGNPPITIRGNAAVDLETGDREDVKAATLPKIKFFRHRGLNNWHIERIQFGYDVDSGDDYNTSGTFERVTDITWTLCHFTGGMGLTQFWAGEFNVDRCVIHSPLPPLGISGGLHPGAGLRMEQSPGEGTGLSIGQLFIDGSEFSNIRGDDGLMIGGLYLFEGAEVVDEASNTVITNTLFWNVTEGDPAFHTDAIQPLQVRRLEVDQCVFLGCSNALQITDFRNGLIRFTRNLCIGIDVPIQCQGVDEIELIQNTFVHVSAPLDLTLMFYDHASLPARPLATIVNNIIGGFFMRDGTSINAYFRGGSVIADNIVLSDPGLTTNYGTNLSGIPEFGYSTRLDPIPDDTVTVGAVERAWELANSPLTSPGIGEGQATDVSNDLFGRAYASPPDVGALQSDPGTLVTPVARSPYITSRSPLANATAVSPSTNITATLYPVPGAEISDASVTASTAFVTDAAGTAIPGVVTLSAPASGFQTITVDLKQDLDPLTEGDLYPLVVFTAHLTGGIEDTNGSALNAATWTFRVAGPAGPAIGATSQASFTLQPDPRFPVGMGLTVWETTGDGRAKGPEVASGTVGADSRVSFTGLVQGVYYVAGPSLAGPFTFFRLY